MEKLFVENKTTTLKLFYFIFFLSKEKTKIKKNVYQKGQNLLVREGIRKKLKIIKILK